MTSVLPVNNGIYSYVMVHHLVIVTQLLDSFPDKNFTLGHIETMFLDNCSRNSISN